MSLQGLDTYIKGTTPLAVEAVMEELRRPCQDMHHRSPELSEKLKKIDLQPFKKINPQPGQLITSNFPTEYIGQIKAKR